MNKDENDISGYMKALADIQGVAVTTVADGWVLLMKNEKLKDLVAASEKSGYAVVFIKSGSSSTEQTN